MPRRMISRISAQGHYENVEPTTDAERASLAVMLRDQSPPQIGGTDSLWFRGQGVKDPFGALPKFVREEFHRRAKAQGLDLAGKEYNPSLVRKEFAERGELDPEAIVGSVSDVRRVLETRPHATSDGMVDQVGRELEDTPDFTYRVRDDIVEDAVIDDYLDQGVTEVPVREFVDKKETLRESLNGAMNA